MSCKWYDVGCHARQAGASVERRVTRPIANVVNQGEVGKFVSNIGNSYLNVAKTPINVVKNIAEGDVKGAGQTAVKFVTSGANVLSYGATGYIGQSSGAQKFLDNKSLDQFTLGISGDYAGFTRAVNEGGRTGNISKENLDDSIRFGGKIGAIATGAYFASGGAAPTPYTLQNSVVPTTLTPLTPTAATTPAVGGSSLLSTLTGKAATGVGYVAQYGPAAYIGSQVLTGKKSASEAADAFFGGGTSDNPIFDWLDNIFPPQAPSAPVQVGGNQSYIPEYIANPIADNLGKAVIFGGLAVGAYFLIKRLS